jgi:hypothetical protein
MAQERQDDVTPEERVRRAHAQKNAAKADGVEVDRVVSRLRRHLEENQFVDRLYQQLMNSRREA